MNTFILYLIIGLVWFIVFNASFSKISVISWLSVLLAEETGVPGQNYRPVANHWQTVSHDVVSSTSSHERDPNSQISLYITISCSIFDSNNMMAINYFGCKWLIDIKYLLEMSAMIFCPQSNEFWPIDFTFLVNCDHSLTLLLYCPCLYYHSVFDSMWLSWVKRICTFFCSFIYIVIGYPVIKRGSLWSH